MLTKYLLRLLINGYESSWVDASEPLQHLHRSHHGKYKSFSTSHFSTDSSITPPELYFIFCWEHWSWEEELSENIIWIKYLWTNNIFSGENFLEQRNSAGKLILLWFIKAFPSNLLYLTTYENVACKVKKNYIFPYFLSSLCCSTRPVSMMTVSLLCWASQS